MIKEEPYYWVAVVGSRDFKNKELIREVLKDVFYTSVGVITGGARGVDTWAEEFCKEKEILCTVLRPIDSSIKINYLYRNVEIIAMAHEVIAFWDGKSRGTKFVIDYAKARNKKIKVYNSKGETIC